MTDSAADPEGPVEIAVAEADAAAADHWSGLIFEFFSERGVIVSAHETGADRWRIECVMPADLGWREIFVALTELPAGEGTPPLPAFTVDRIGRKAWQSAAQSEFEPVHAGRFLVHDRAHRPAAGGISVEIDAGQAFGTGHHATTAGCLIALDGALKRRRFRTVLDLGCGSGVLAIAAAKALRLPVLASDIDPVAVAVARENARRNAVGPLLRCVTAAGLAHPALAQKHALELVMANILAGPLLALATPLARAVAPGATIILSGLLAEQMARVVARYGSAGFSLESRLVIKEWATLTFSASGPPEGGERKPVGS